MAYRKHQVRTTMKRSMVALATIGAFGFLFTSSIPSTTLRCYPAPIPDRSLRAPSNVDLTANLQDSAFPSVDWEWWQSVNQDLVGWITIPGTSIDGPVVQAAKEAPDFYLTHDVYRNASCYGCIYLDAASPPLSTEARTGNQHEGGNELAMRANRLICGHNPGFGNHMQFADLTRFSDSSFAAEHRTVLLQTPRTRSALRVACATVEPQGGTSNRTSFANGREFSAWWNGICAAASVRTETTIPEATQVFTFCTCSYGSDDERTLVFAYEPEES